MKQRIMVGLLSLIGAVYACSNTCSAGSICGDGNLVSPAPVVIFPPTPAPLPSPSPAPSMAVCPLGPSAHLTCAPAVPQLAAAVAEAQSKLTAGASESAYVASLVAALRAVGLCATSGGLLPSDEIAVKSSNTFSETFDVWNAANFPQLLYQSTCTPARF